jgi:hypothetical protein
MKRRPLFNTKTQLENIPKEWLNHIEPHVVRGAFLPCWVWAGQCDRNGYPTMRVDGKMVMVHRFVASLFWTFGKDKYVRRRCHVQNCVNPNHIYVTSKHHLQK